MASSCGTDIDKGSLRQGYLAARKGISEEDKTAFDDAIRENLLSFEYYQKAPLVLTYVSYDKEIDTRAIIEAAFDFGKLVAVPLTDPKTHDLSFYLIESVDDLVPGYKGILEPEPMPTRCLKPGNMVGSVCLVPGLVFDASGRRVGYGGGCYDRFLKFYPGHKIGLCRSTQVSGGDLPHDDHDVSVDFLVTEKGVWECR